MKIKQKISALLVLALFMLSILPAGLADENIVEVSLDTEVKLDSETEVKTETENESSTTEVEAETEAEAETEVKVKEKDSLKRETKVIRKEVKEVRKNLEQAREKLQEAKERYQEAKEKQREHREKVLELHQKIKRCNSETEDCANLKVELRLGVKNHLLKSVQVVERSLEKLTKTVEKMEDLSEEEKAYALELVANLDAELEVQKAKIEGFTNETTQEEIRATIKDLKELNQKVHQLQRRLVGLLVNAKLSVLVEKQADLHASMQARIDTAAEAGADVTELEAILAKFDAKVTELKQDYETAKQKWMEAKTAEDFDQFNRELRTAQHKVREDLKEIKKILREFLKEYQEMKEELEENKVEEVENESEEASEDQDESAGEETETNTSLEANASATATA